MDEAFKELLDTLTKGEEPTAGVLCDALEVVCQRLKDRNPSYDLEAVMAEIDGVRRYEDGEYTVGED